MKNQKTQNVTIRHTRSQKIWGAVALGAIFACGLFVGVAMNRGASYNAVINKQCDGLARQIVRASSESYLNTSDLARLRELNEVYEKNCAGYIVDVEVQDKKSAEQVAAQIIEPDQETCEVIEIMMLREILPEDYADPNVHNNNIATYKKLIKHGCPENAEKYQALIARETEILAALTGGATENDKTCAEIEALLMQRLPGDDMNDSDVRIERAKIYANLSERGCPENSQAYVNLAAKELEIARALRDDQFNEPEAIEVVETYKRLQMKQAANDVINKVQQLTDPAIDFMLQVQKIIEE